MKLNFFIIALWGALSFLTFSYCGDPSSKVDSKATEVEVKQNDLDKAERDFEKEWDEFKSEIDAEINENNNSILTYREMGKKDKAYKDKYSVEIDKLESENKRLKDKFNSYNTDDKVKSNWQEFKREFRHDMDQLGRSIKDLGKNNKK